MSKLFIIIILLLFNCGERPIREISTYTNQYRSFAFSNDSKLFAYVREIFVAEREPREIGIIDMETGRDLLILKNDTFGCYSITISPDNKFVAVGCVEGKIYIWDLETGGKVKTLEVKTNAEHGSYIQYLLYDHTGEYLIATNNSVSMNESYKQNIGVNIFNIAEEKVISYIKTQNFQAGNYPVLSPKESFFLVSFGPDLLMFDTKTMQKVKEFKIFGSSFSINRSSTKIVTQRSIHDYFTVIDIETGQTQNFIISNEMVGYVAFSNYDDRIVICANDKKQIILWDLQENKEIYRFKAHDSNVIYIKSSPDGEVFTTNSNLENIKFWNMKEILKKAKYKK
jgi:WD40 repeat protein